MNREKYLIGASREISGSKTDSRTTTLKSEAEVS
jgi:hypothetical protein